MAGRPDCSIEFSSCTECFRVDHPGKPEISVNFRKRTGIAFAAALFSGSFAMAQTIDGMCFVPDPCTGMIEIRDNRFDTCEQSCRLQPTQTLANGAATLQELTCVGDGMPQYQGQAVFLPLEDDSAYFLDDLGVHVLHRCDVVTAASSWSNAPDNLGFQIDELQGLYLDARGMCRGTVFDLHGAVSDHACELVNTLSETLTEAGYVFDRGEQEWVLSTSAPVD